MDMEFTQFHPTALVLPDRPVFLISEAVRGEGALLYNTRGERFMPRYDAERAELAPRDVVARAAVQEMLETGADHILLDVTSHDAAWLATRFPSIYARCLEAGLDMAHDRIPVSPAAHYTMGGVRTNTWGETTVRGLFAVGETACTGAHGANRLASNSLLETVVFAHRAVERLLNPPDPLPPPEAPTAGAIDLAPRGAGRARARGGRGEGTDVARRRHRPLGGEPPPGRGPTAALGLLAPANERPRQPRAALDRDLLAPRDRGGAHPRGVPGRTLPHGLPGAARSVAATYRVQTRRAHIHRRGYLGAHARMTVPVPPPPADAVAMIIASALDEDRASYDVTTRTTVPPDQPGEATVLYKQDGVICGLEVLAQVFQQVSDEIEVTSDYADGDWVEAGTAVAEVTGPLAAILSGERVALNLLQRMSGIATMARVYTDAAARGGTARVVDTRKTTPGLRAIERYAVRAGGAHNHRNTLEDGVLIKDNHIEAAAQREVDLAGVIALARSGAAHTPSASRLRSRTPRWRARRWPPAPMWSSWTT
jgi:nicotinate-nucleotide pyrophosphorylase (carboxylating)